VWSIRCLSIRRRSYAPRQGNDRLLLGLGSLNEYELDLLRQRSLAARHEKARRGELIVMAPVGYLKTDESAARKGSRPARARGDQLGVRKVLGNYPHDARTVILCGGVLIILWSTKC
jgi:DNA invertase Pin-like site-specific DNA recombinase